MIILLIRLSYYGDFMDLKEKLISPLEDLQADIESQVTVRYVESQIVQGNRNIQLPSQLQQQYETAVVEVNSTMQRQSKDIDAEHFCSNT